MTAVRFAVRVRFSAVCGLQRGCGSAPLLLRSSRGLHRRTAPHHTAPRRKVGGSVSVASGSPR